MILREYEKETSESIAWCQWPRNEQLNVSFFFLKGMFYSPNRKAKKPPFPGGGGVSGLVSGDAQYCRGRLQVLVHRTGASILWGTTVGDHLEDHPS